MMLSGFVSLKLSLFVIAALLMSHWCVLGYNSASTQKGRYDHRRFAKRPNGAQAGASRSFNKKTITGQNIINVRSFNLDAPKTFTFDGSFKSIGSLPTFSSPEIAFMGRSNVGKSSLLNCLTGMSKKIAVEGKTPGRTQSINVFNCQDKLGDICKFVDLPGYGYAKISKTQQSEISQFIGDYLIRRGALKLVILLIDPRREVQQYDQDMFKFLDQHDVPFAMVATKVDKMKSNELEKSLSSLAKAFNVQEHELLPFSAVTGQGRKEIWRAIRATMLDEDEEEEEEGEVGDEMDRQE